MWSSVVSPPPPSNCQRLVDFNGVVLQNEKKNNKTLLKSQIDEYSEKYSSLAFVMLWLTGLDSVHPSRRLLHRHIDSAPAQLIHSPAKHFCFL